jgi:hypothetical protein
LKLRPRGRESPLNYHALRGHFIVIPQDPGPLLQILPSPELQLDHLIKVIWLGDRPPADTDLNPFFLVRKHKVLAALHYLVRNNYLYYELTINHPMMDSWSDEFIPPELQNSIIYLDEADHHEREGYTVDLQRGNYENDFQAAEDNAFEPDGSDPLLTGSVTSDITGDRQNPDTRTIHTLLDLVTSKTHSAKQPASTTNDGLDTGQPSDHRRFPVISYTIRGRTALVNHWDDHRYFTAAFPTLFPAGIGGHLDPRTVPVSLPAFARWALSHHSKRFVVSNNGGELLLISLDSLVIGPLCTCYTMYCNSDPPQWGIVFLLNATTGNQ